MDWERWAAIAAVAPLVGFIGMFAGGFWSVGCGWLIVPSMLIFGFTPMEAVGVGLLQMVPSILPTVVKEVRSVGWRRGEIGRNLVVPMALGSFATSFCGRPINEFFHRLCGSVGLSVGFGVFMLFIGAQTLLGKGRKYGDQTPLAFTAASRVWAFLAGLGAGIFSSVLGVGGAMVFRPALANGFKASELDVARCTRLLLLTTTLVGGATYLFGESGIRWTILGTAAAIAAGGAVGFPLGAKAHKVVVDAGYASEARRSFAIICGIVVVNVTLKTVDSFVAADLAFWSRRSMLVAAVGLFLYLVAFVERARRNPRTPNAGDAGGIAESPDRKAPTGARSNGNER